VAEFFSNAKVRIHLFAKVLVRDIERSDMFKYASAMAYVTLFSIVPSIAAVFAVVSLFKPMWGNNGELLGVARDFILNNLAQGSGQQAVQFLENAVARLDLARIGFSGLAVMMFTLVMLLRNIELALNRIFHVTKERNTVARFIYFWTFITLGTFVIGVVIGGLSDFDFSNLNPFASAPRVVKRGYGAWLFSKFVVFLFFAMLYRFAPNKPIPLRDAMVGGAVSTVLFTVAAQLFSVFTARFTNFASLYGALAAVPLFLSWLYVIWLIILFGGIITSRCMHGFNLDETIQELKFKAKSPREQFRNRQTESFVAFVILLVICERFEDGSGAGITFKNIKEKTGLPDEWILDAILILSELRLVLGRSDAASDPVIPHEPTYFPTFPPSGYPIHRVVESLYGDAQEWLQEWRPAWNVNLNSLYKFLLEAGWEKKPTMSIAELIALSKPPA